MWVKGKSGLQKKEKWGEEKGTRSIFRLGDYLFYQDESQRV